MDECDARECVGVCLVRCVCKNSFSCACTSDLGVNGDIRTCWVQRGGGLGRGWVCSTGREDGDQRRRAAFLDLRTRRDGMGFFLGVVGKLQHGGRSDADATSIYRVRECESATDEKKNTCGLNVAVGDFRRHHPPGVQTRGEA